MLFLGHWLAEGWQRAGRAREPPLVMDVWRQWWWARETEDSLG